MTGKRFSDWQEAWDEVTCFKTPAERRFALEAFLRAPINVLMRLARANREPISKTLRLPKPDRTSRYFFAGKRRGNVLKDVVHIGAFQSRRRLEIEEILICHKVRVSRVPDFYLIREEVLAAAGCETGHRVVNVDEFLWSSDPPQFRDDFEACLPRLREYKNRGSVVRCFWSTRGLKLADWRRRLTTNDESKLLQGLNELFDLMYSSEFANDVMGKVREALSGAIRRFSTHSNPEIKLRAMQIGNAGILSWYGTPIRDS